MVWVVRKTTHFSPGAILDMICVSGKIVTCGRDSSVRIWDPEMGRSIATFQAHMGHAIGIVESSHHSVISAGQDGIVKCWDHRVPDAVHNLCITTNGSSLSNLSIGPNKEGPIFVSASDTTVCGIDARTFTPRSRWMDDHKFSIYSLLAVGDGTVVSGGGDGSLAHRTSEGRLLDKRKMDDNAIRGMITDRTGRLVAVTDDGNIHSL